MGIMGVGKGGPLSASTYVSPVFNPGRCFFSRMGTVDLGLSFRRSAVRDFCVGGVCRVLIAID